MLVVSVRTLSLSDCYRVSLNAMDIGFVVSSSKRLTSLNLSGCMFLSEEAVQQLVCTCSKSNINTLYVTRCNISSADVVMLVETLPKLRYFAFSVPVAASKLLAINSASYTMKKL